MAKVSSVHSDTDGGGEGAVPKQANKKPAKAVEEPMDVDEGEGVDDGSGAEEEYEIEAILDAKRGSFPEVRLPPTRLEARPFILNPREGWDIL